MKKVCILGQGYIGLPTALMFATHGLKVLGMDVNQEIIHTLSNGGLHIEETGSIRIGLMRESPALDVIHLLQQKEANVTYHDPYIPQFKHDGWEMQSISDLMPAVRSADMVVIATNHSGYDYSSILTSASLIVDTRNALGKLGKNNLKVVRL